jgi:predicted metal-dependent TIM-barrel fold hydrolase
MPGNPPALFDLHIYPEGIGDQDLESMRFFGVEAALATAHYALPAVNARNLLDQFDRLFSVQLPRLERAGIQPYAALGIDPRCLPRRGLDEVLQRLPQYFSGGRVLAICSGFQSGDEAEEEALQAHLGLARQLALPVLLQTPHHRKAPLTRRLLSLLRDSDLPPQQVLMNHADGKTIRPIRACGHYAGLTLHPDAMSGERAIGWIRRLGSQGVILGSQMGSGAGDLAALARAVNLLRKTGLSERLSTRVRWSNARAFLKLESTSS